MVSSTVNNVTLPQNSPSKRDHFRCYHDVIHQWDDWELFRSSLCRSVADRQSMNDFRSVVKSFQLVECIQKIFLMHMKPRKESLLRFIEILRGIHCIVSIWLLSKLLRAHSQSLSLLQMLPTNTQEPSEYVKLTWDECHFCPKIEMWNNIMFLNFLDKNHQTSCNHNIGLAFWWLSRTHVWQATDCIFLITE
jgi:hypothetical protein